VVADAALAHDLAVGVAARVVRIAWGDAAGGRTASGRR
jgi:hypothetical protein